MLSSRYKNLIAIVLLILISITLYGLTLRGVYGNPQVSEFKNNLDQNLMPFELSPERGRFLQVIALAERGTYAMDQQMAEAAYPDVGFYQDSYFSYFAPGVPYLALPLYLVGDDYNLAQVASFALVSLVSIFTLIFIFKIAREVFKLPVWASVLASVAFGFASTSWSYAVTLYQHHFTAFFMVSSFYAAWRFKQGGGRLNWLWAAMVWLNYGLGIFVDYPNAVLLLPAVIYLLVSSFNSDVKGKKINISIRPAVVLTVIVFIAITGLHLYHNQYYYGSWSNLSATLPQYQSEIENPQTGVADQAAETEADSSSDKTAIGFFKETNLIHSFTVLVLSTDRGLLLFVPTVLLAIFGIIYAFRTLPRREVGFLLAFILTNLFVYSSWGDAWGGWAYGPRYLIPSMAILSLFVALPLARLKDWYLLRGAAFILLAYSSAIALLGALTTNAIPGVNEAVDLNTGFNFLRNWEFFIDGKSGTFLYNYFFNQYLTLENYALVLYTVLLLIFAVLLFVLPKLEYED